MLSTCREIVSVDYIEINRLKKFIRNRQIVMKYRENIQIRNAENMMILGIPDSPTSVNNSNIFMHISEMSDSDFSNLRLSASDSSNTE
jgi:hypothetical protein